MISVLLLVACSAHAPRQDTPHSMGGPTSAAGSGLPGEVTTLTERWEQCWHFAGEEPYDAARRAELEAAIAKWCPGNDDERARLRTKYRGNADVARALKALDEMQ